MQRVDLNEHSQLAALTASALNQVLTAQRPCERLKNVEVVQGIDLQWFALAKWRVGFGHLCRRSPLCLQKDWIRALEQQLMADPNSSRTWSVGRCRFIHILHVPRDILNWWCALSVVKTGWGATNMARFWLFGTSKLVGVTTRIFVDITMLYHQSCSFASEFTGSRLS